MAGEWKTTTLGELITSNGGSLLTGPFGTALKASEYAATGVPIVSVSEVGFGRIELKAHTPRVDPNVTSRLAKYLLQEGDIVFARKGAGTAVERSALVTEREAGWFLGSDGIRVRLPLECHPRFVSYWLLSKSHRDWMKQHAVGTTMPALNQGILERIPISMPPFREQQAIACILGALDDKIELNRRRNRTLEAMARAIFQSWFVDFDPVRAKTEGRKPPGLSQDTAALFPDSFEDSELGEIPKGWHVGTVGDVADFNDWTLGKRDELDTIDYIEISEVMRGEIANITRYPRGEEPGRARRRLRHGDTAISTVRPDRGSYFLCLDPPPSLIASTGFAVLTAKGGRWAFAHVLATRSDFGQELGRLADGGAYPAVRPEVIAARLVVIPANDRICSAFEKLAQPLLLKAEAGRKESRILAALRDTLLPKLISGELRVLDAERIVGRAI